MSDMPASLPLMRKWVTEKALTRLLADEGVTVIETCEGMCGDSVAWYSKADRLIALHPDLTDRQRLPALLHEFFHHLRGDDGPQSDAVEAWIDEQVALVLVDPAEYAYWEREYGWSTGGIAHALEVPRWVIEAYRRVLKRELVQGLPR